jgi:hypothetical protein
MPYLQLVENDTEPTELELTAQKRPAPLGNADTIVLTMRQASGSKVVTRDDCAAVGDPDDGVIEIPWQAGDLSPAGIWHAQVTITDIHGIESTWPSEGDPAVLVVDIHARLA